MAHHLEHVVEGGEVAAYADAARTLGVTRARLSQLLALLGLAPDIQEQILAGDLDAAEHALRPVMREVEWREQRHRLGGPAARRRA